MAILFGCLIGVLTVVIAVVTYLKYIPHIIKTRKVGVDSSNPPADNSVETDVDASVSLNKGLNRKQIIITVASGLFGAVIGYFAYSHPANEIAMLKMVFAFLILTVVMVTDIEILVITNACSIVMIAARLVFGVVELIVGMPNAAQILLRNLLVAVATLVFLLIIYKITRGGIGFGDVKVLSSLAFLCGAGAVIYTFVISLFFSAITSIVLLIAKKKKIKDELPMGPFIWLAYGVAIIISLV